MNELAPFAAPVVASLVAVSVGIAALKWDRSRTRGVRAGGGALVASLAMISGFIAVEGLPPLWPTEATDSLVPLSLVLLLLSALQGRFISRPAWLTLLRMAISVALLRWLLSPLITWSWSTSESVMWGLGLCVIWTVAWTSSSLAAARVPARSSVGALALCVGLSAMALAATGSLKLGQLEGALGAGLGLFALAGLRWGDEFPGRSATSVAVPLSTLLVTTGVVFSELPPVAGAILALSPLSIWAGQRDTTGFPWRGALVATLFAGLGLACAIGLSPAPPDPSSYGNYG